MKIALKTGSSGLIGSEDCDFCQEKGIATSGIVIDPRGYFIGSKARTINVEDQFNIAGIKSVIYHIVIPDICQIEDFFSLQKVFNFVVKELNFQIVGIVLETVASWVHFALVSSIQVTNFFKVKYDNAGATYL